MPEAERDGARIGGGPDAAAAAPAGALVAAAVAAATGGGAAVLLLGTSHTCPASAAAAFNALRHARPSAVAIEVDAGRLPEIQRRAAHWLRGDVSSLVRRQTAPLLAQWAPQLAAAVASSPAPSVLSAFAAAAPAAAADGGAAAADREALCNEAAALLRGGLYGLDLALAAAAAAAAGVPLLCIDRDAAATRARLALSVHDSASDGGGGSAGLSPSSIAAAVTEAARRLRRVLSTVLTTPWQPWEAWLAERVHPVFALRGSAALRAQLDAGGSGISSGGAAALAAAAGRVAAAAGRGGARAGDLHALRAGVAAAPDLWLAPPHGGADDSEAYRRVFIDERDAHMAAALSAAAAASPLGAGPIAAVVGARHVSGVLGRLGPAPVAAAAPKTRPAAGRRQENLTIAAEFGLAGSCTVAYGAAYRSLPLRLPLLRGLWLAAPAALAASAAAAPVADWRRLRRLAAFVEELAAFLDAERAPRVAASMEAGDGF